MMFYVTRSSSINAYNHCPGLSIVRDLLLPVQKKHPEISIADLWLVRVAIKTIDYASVA